MKRRDALKNLGLATGFFVATPTIVSLLQSCTSDVKMWMPEFLTSDQGIALTKIVDIILPKTENLPSATELNVPQFIDKYLNEVLEDEDQAKFRVAFENMVSILRPNPEEPIGKVTDEAYKALLDKNMLIKDEIDQEREANLESLELTKSEFLNSLKWMTINAYLTTEQIGENVLVYDPVPSQYYCGDLQELTGGKSYSL
ncbi:MAG: gluconate 2-dehydrogenase subunit 3 family protein [Flavobacteriaceae bacterium]|tara:strand:+ start:3914 stop:4513 length:600 start_codon:yes stop_codon:yes gene_type:complete